VSGKKRRLKNPVPTQGTRNGPKKRLLVKNGNVHYPDGTVVDVSNNKKQSKKKNGTVKDSKALKSNSMSSVGNEDECVMLLMQTRASMDETATPDEKVTVKKPKSTSANPASPFTVLFDGDRLLPALKQYARIFGDVSRIPQDFVIPRKATWLSYLWDLPLGALAYQLEHFSDVKSKPGQNSIPELSAIRIEAFLIQNRKDLDGLGQLKTVKKSTMSLADKEKQILKVTSRSPKSKLIPNSDHAMAEAGIGEKKSKRELFVSRLIEALTIYKKLKGNVLVPHNFRVPIAKLKDSVDWPQSLLGFRLGKHALKLRTGGTEVERWLNMPPVPPHKNTLRQFLSKNGFLLDLVEYEWVGLVMPGLRKYYYFNHNLSIPSDFTIPAGSKIWPKSLRGYELGAKVKSCFEDQAYNKFIGKNRAELQSMGGVHVEDPANPTEQKDKQKTLQKDDNNRLSMSRILG